MIEMMRVAVGSEDATIYIGHTEAICFQKDLYHADQTNH